MIGPVTDARAVIAAAALLLGVTACSGDDPEPIIAPTPSSSAPSDPSTSPSPTPEVSAEDEQAAFLEKVVDELSAALSSGDADQFLSLASPDCQNCRVMAENLESAYADGGHIEGGRWVVARSSYTGEEPLGAIWNLDVRSARERWYDSSGELVKIVRGGVQRFGVALVASGDTWQVRELRLRTT